MSENFGNFLKEKRKEVNLTQKELGEKLFVSESTVSKWEQNKANPDISMIPKLCSILNVSEHELLNASVDMEERDKTLNAKKWKILSTTWDYFFLISYSVALLTCFICNLAVNKTLSWFFIVLFSIILSASFTTFPKYIKNNRLLVISLLNLICLIFLLGVCCLYTKGNWFFISVLPIILGYIMIFLPILIAKYNLPEFIKKHNAIISVVSDEILLLIMLYVINVKVNGSWFFSFALPLSICFFACAVILVLVIRYSHFNKLIKSAISVFLFIPFCFTHYFLLKKLLPKVSSEPMQKIYFPNFNDWVSSEMISSNVIWIILLSLLLVSLILLLISLGKSKK